MDINNRELATITIILFLLSYAFYKDKERGIIKQLKLLLKSLFAKPILITILLFILYISLEVFILSEIGFWERNLLKDTIIWSITAFALIVNHQHIIQKEHFLKQIIIDNIKLIALFEFIMNFYSFNYIAELFIVGIVTLIVGMQAVIPLEQNNVNIELTKKVLNIIQAIIGAIILYFTITKLLDNSSEFFITNTLKSFLLPLVLILLYIPFYYLLIIYAKFELINRVIDIFIEDATLSKYLKKLILQKSLLRYGKLKVIHPKIYLFSKLNTKNEFKEKLEKIF